MPWKEVSPMSQREEFIVRARQDAANISALCREYGISRKTAYKWLSRFEREGAAGLAQRSRRPKSSPRRSASSLEQLIVAARQDHPAWGARKLKAFLHSQGQADLPAPSTITAILRRHGLLSQRESVKHRPFQRFEMAGPNQLWQMDFKGPVPLLGGRPCHPLTVLDDHSRFLLGLQACAIQDGATVQTHLTSLFRAFGLPERMLMDNGSPWGGEGDNRYSVLSVWLLRLGIAVSHGRPRHPQTQGKDERLHRSLEAELLKDLPAQSLSAYQVHFDAWRSLYNYQRPHQALADRPPATRYTPSPRPFPETLPPLHYAPSHTVRKPDANGIVCYHGRELRVGKAFRAQRVALRPDALIDGLLHVFLGDIHVRTFNLHQLS